MSRITDSLKWEALSEMRGIIRHVRHAVGARPSSPRSTVVLPVPFGPMTRTNSPAFG